MHLILAPLQGITTWVYRANAAARFGGFDRAMAPFVSTVREEQIKDTHLRDIALHHNAGSIPLIPQIMGSDPEDFLRLAERMADLGYREINWNLGCPSRTVTKKKRGCGMLPFTDSIEAFLTRLIPRMPVALSIKARLGYSSPSDLARLIPVLNRFPLAQLIVHPRIGTQMYEGVVDLDRFAEVLESSTNPVTFNGDIRSEADFSSLTGRFPRVKAWMIGRGAIADPFLPVAIASGVRPDNCTGKFKAFHDALFSQYRCLLHGPAPVLGKMKELWSYWAQSFLEGKKILKRVRRSPTLEVYHRAVEDFFSNAPVYGGATQ